MSKASPLKHRFASAQRPDAARPQLQRVRHAQRQGTLAVTQNAILNQCC
ncbi:MAG TPA: hypothetical protein V6D06_19890 [Trichocoleus sp.]